MTIIVDASKVGMANVVLRPTLSGRLLKITMPPLPLGAVVGSLQLKVAKTGSGIHAYLRTPPTCPKSKAWRFTGRFTYAGGAVRTLLSQSACLAR